MQFPYAPKKSPNRHSNRMIIDEGEIRNVGYYVDDLQTIRGMVV